MAKTKNTVNNKTSVRTDTGHSLLNIGDLSREEKRLKKDADITASWRRVEAILKSDSGNSWELGDEFSKLTALKISDREIADRVGKGKTWVNDLLQTADAFPTEKRKAEYTWWTHDLVRRACNKINAEAEENGIESNMEGLIDKIFTSVKAATARTTMAAVAVALSVMVEAKTIKQEDAAKLKHKPEERHDEMVIVKVTGYNFLAIRQTKQPVPGGWKPVKLASRKLQRWQEQHPEGECLIISCTAGRPDITVSMAKLLLSIAEGSKEAADEFAAQFLDKLPPRSDYAGEGGDGKANDGQSSKGSKSAFEPSFNNLDATDPFDVNTQLPK